MKSSIKWVLNIVSLILILFGVVWALQGANVLPGSFMTGQVGWLIGGIAAALVGIGLLVFVNRRRKSDVS